MKKPTRKEILIFVTLALFLIIFGILIFPYQWMILIWIFVIAMGIYYFTWRIMGAMHIENREVIRQVTDYAEESTKQVLETMPLGVLRYNRENQALLWLNPYADYVFTGQQEELNSEKIREILALNEQEKNFMDIGEKQYYFYIHKEEGLIYFIDVSNEQSLRQEIQNRQLVVGVISVDNYDDVTENMEEKETSILNSMITSIVSDWLNEHKVFSKRLNREKYFFVARYKILKNMMNQNFQLIDDFREKMVENNTPLTLSIGVGFGMASPKYIGEIANNNLEIALVRGGDQVVVKEDVETSKPLYFGGKSDSVVKRTRVRTRAMATALKGILQDTEEVYIMGHRFPDMDAIGASFGMLYLARMFGKTAYVVLDSKQFIHDVERCMEEIKEYPELFDCVVTPEYVKENRRENSLLVMVDYNKPVLSISKEVYSLFEKIIVIDHHRRSDEFPQSPLLSYIESGASSASELITELIQYQSTKTTRISRIEATLLMAGIVVDTKSFQMRTTSRTFDTASFLRSMGADNSKVQALLSSDLQSYMEMNELISSNEKITEEMIIACGDDDKVYDSVTNAKAADTILSLNGVEATFVISRRNHETVGISARSKGKVNVQVLMEKLGGGGHFNNAAVQMKEITTSAAKAKLVEAIELKKDDIYNKN